LRVNNAGETAISLDQLEEFILFLRKGSGVISLKAETRFHNVLQDYKQNAAELAGLSVNLIHTAADDGDVR
jgi:hypothetical protein